MLWDAEDERSDVYLDAAIMIAKALALRTKTISKASSVDIEAVDKAIREIERQAGFSRRNQDEVRDNQERR